MPSPQPSHLTLSKEVESLWRSSVAESTHLTYQTGVRRFQKFLIDYNYVWQKDILPSPSTELFCNFIAYCHSILQLRYSTIKLYLAGIRFHYLARGRGNPLSIPEVADRVQIVLRGVKRQQGCANLRRLPITFSVLRNMCQILRQGCFSQFEDTMLMAVCTTAFFGFMRSGEFCAKGSTSNPSVPLCVEDVNIVSESEMTIMLKASKTDPFREGIVIKIFTNQHLCPIQAMQTYLKCRRSVCTESPALFVIPDGSPLHRTYFVCKLKEVISCLGLDSSKYNGHSFRIGAATTAAQAGVEDHMIQTLGRWASTAYTTYIHTSKKTLQAAQEAMCVSERSRF